MHSAGRSMPQWVPADAPNYTCFTKISSNNTLEGSDSRCWLLEWLVGAGKSLRQLIRLRRRYDRLSRGGDQRVAAQAWCAIQQIDAVIAARQDPDRAVRCALPAKQQRMLGLLPKVEAK